MGPCHTITYTRPEILNPSMGPIFHSLITSKLPLIAVAINKSPHVYYAEGRDVLCGRGIAKEDSQVDSGAILTVL